MAKKMLEKHQCKNEKECKRKREKYEELQSKFAIMGQEELDAFLKVMQEGKAFVRFDRHFTKRSLERSISDRDVKEVLENGVGLLNAIKLLKRLLSCY